MLRLELWAPFAKAELPRLSLMADTPFADWGWICWESIANGELDLLRALRTAGAVGKKSAKPFEERDIVIAESLPQGYHIVRTAKASLDSHCGDRMSPFGSHNRMLRVKI